MAPDTTDTTDTTATPDTSGPTTDPTRRLYELLQTRGAFIPSQTRQRLETDLSNAGKAWKAGSSCDLATALEAFVKNLQPVAESPPTLVTHLTTLARAESRAAVRAARAAGKPCAGFEAVDTPLGLKNFDPSDTQARAEITFPPADLRLVWSELDKRAFAELAIPGVLGAGTRVGRPQIPFVRLLVAIPDGATFRFATSNLKTREKLRLDLVPARPDNRVIDPPFARSTWRYDAERYGTSGRYPEAPCTFDEAGAYRGLRLGFITCSAGQLDLSTRTLTLFSGLEVTVTFTGTKGWASRVLDGGFEDLDLIAETAINGPMIARGRRLDWGFKPGLVDLTGRGPCTESSGDRGESFLIFTAPKFRAQADRLAELRRSEGLPTRVINTLVGDTQETLDQILETRFLTCPIRAKYVLLFGDSDTLPAHMLLRDFDGVDPVFIADKGNLASDALLAHLGPIDAFPDFAVGRLPVQTVAEAERVVSRLERWQSAPTTAGRDYFRRIAIGGAFECCATGDDVPEGQEASLFTAKVRDVIVAANARGLELDVHMSKTGPDVTPRLDFFGSELPPPLRPEDRYPWSANRRDVLDAFTRGTSVFIYSNHGGPSTWSEPGGVGVSDLASIDNAETFSPFVLNFTCLANHFDNEQNTGVYRAGPGRQLGELLVLGNDTLAPAVGVLGSTRVSWGYPNMSMMQGVADGLEPATLPGFGGGDPVLRAGEAFDKGALWTALNHDEARAPLALVNGKVAGAYYQNMMSYVHLGDPTARLPRRGYTAPEAGALAPIGPSTAAIPQFSDAGWVAFDDVSGDLLPQGPAEVVAANYTFDATHPVIVDWVGGGLTVLGGAEGSFITAYQTIRYGVVRDKRFLGRAQVENQRADLHFVPGAGSAWPLASEVVLTTPAQTNHILRNDGTGDYATGFSGIDIFPAAQLESFTGFESGALGGSLEIGAGRLRLTTPQSLSISAGFPGWGNDGQVAVFSGAIGVNPRFTVRTNDTTHAIGLRLGVVPLHGNDPGRTLRVKVAVRHSDGAVDLLRWPIVVGVMHQIGVSTVDGIESVDVDFEPGDDVTNGAIIDDVRWN